MKTKEFKSDGPGKDCLIVGIGASAGGLEAFKSFFSAMPADSGMVFVLIQHLSPDYPTMLVELIGRTTQMKVREAENGMMVMANHVYIIPPNATMTIENGHLAVTRPAPPRENRHPIDMFLFSLAREQGEKAVCIILSGTGSDGSLGLTAIKEQGGITFAQAEFDHLPKSGMPKSADATGNVDHVLQVEDIPAILMEYQSHLRKVQPKKSREGTRNDLSEYLPQIFAQLRTGIGHDFSHYKEKTLIRRVQRRMQVLQLDEPSDFINVLKEDPKELELLFHELLISVTEFFRDSNAFLAFEEQIIPKLLQDKGADSQIRVWVVACATGEEAYSIAILLAEAIEKLLPAAPKVVIFATDIDEKALSFARNGRYLKSHLDGVSPDRLRRWFFQEGDQYCISSQIREMCIFSAHSVVKDPPFSKLDLLSCRNLLIYFDTTLQDRLLPVFHYALQPGGFLFLGSSEGIGRRNELFSIIDEKHRLFKRLDETTVSLPHYPLLTSLGIQKNTKASVLTSEQRKNLFERGARRVMERYSPTHVVIDRQHQILSFSGQTGKFLDPSPGAASLDFFQLIQRALRPTARILLQKAFANQQRVLKENVPFEVNGASETVTLIIEPIVQASGEALHYIVVFQQVDDWGERREGDTSSEGKSTEVELLENELRITRERLQAALDETSEAMEDLKSSNEEFQSINEELHSSNEELETSKEEMQSINEELQTVNAELSNKNQLLLRMNSDLQNFFESTQIATLFLDEKLCVRNFTPTVTELFHLRESDKGRRVTEVTNRLNYDNLESDVKESLQSLEVIEREVALLESGTTFIMKIQPYRTLADAVEGVVITFVDITERKHYEVALALSEMSKSAVLSVALDALVTFDKNGNVLSWNASAEKTFGYTQAEAMGHNLGDLVIPDRDRESYLAGFQNYQESQGESISEGRRIEVAAKHKNGTEFWMEYATTRITLNDTIFFTSTFRDITENKHHAEALKAAKEEAEAANRRKDEFMALMSHELRTPLTAIIGYSQMILNGMVDPLSEKYSQYIQIIHSSGNHLLGMINDLLDISKIEAGKMTVSMEAIELAPLVDTIKAMMDELAVKKQLSLSFEVQPGLDKITVDPARFKQILINLVSNAIKFNRNGGSVYVRLHQSEDRSWLIGEVQDTGIGISPDKMSQLFKKFYQVDTSPSRKNEGTGLGLALTKELIELHGGDITVKSEEGIGTTFTFRLPLT